MARFYKTGGAGGGVSSDELTGTLGDVIKGVTVVASDTNDEIGTGTLELTGDAGTDDVVASKTYYTTDPKTKNIGTLADKNGTTQSATPTLDDANSRVVIPVPETGRYDTSSKLYAAYSTIASLIGLTGSKIVSGNTILGVPGTATGDATLDSAGDMLNGVIGYGKNGTKYVGNIASLAGGTKTPTTSQQTIACKNKYMTSDIVIPAFSLPAASSIKKGVTVTIYGKSVTGTWEGYATNPTYLLRSGEWENLQTTGLTCVSFPDWLEGCDYNSKGSNRNDGDDYITLGCQGTAGGGKSGLIICRLNQTVDLSSFNYIKWPASLFISRAGTITGYLGVSTNSKLTTTSLTSAYSQSITNTSSSTNSSDSYTFISNVSSLTGSYYIYFILNMNLTSSDASASISGRHVYLTTV